MNFARGNHSVPEVPPLPLFVKRIAERGDCAESEHAIFHNKNIESFVRNIEMAKLMVIEVVFK